MSPSSAPSVRSRWTRRPSRAGFTLGELSVALVAGLIVALAVVGLSKEATTTFHEEARVATAEMALRSAIERMRADISRASYMSTPNIYNDPQLAPVYASSLGGGTLPASIQTLAGIRYVPGGSVKKANITSPVAASAVINGTDESATLSTTNFAATGSPDSIDISGNLNGSEVFTVGKTSPGTCGTDSVRLSFAVYNPPVYRLMAGGTAAGVKELQRQFMPAGQPSIARIVDQQGRTQYQRVCKADVDATAVPRPQPYIDVGAVSEAKGSAGGSLGFSGLSVNPVLTVRYKIAPSLAAYSTALYTSADTTKFDLYRIYVDADGVEVTSPPPELVAEYAVDLRFALNADLHTVGADAGIEITRGAFGSDTNGGPVAFGTQRVGTGPQRIRSVSVRLSTRTATADRTTDIGATDAGAVFRYCVAPGSPCTKFARMRTLATEVALSNQATAVY